MTPGLACLVAVLALQPAPPPDALALALAERVRALGGEGNGIGLAAALVDPTGAESPRIVAVGRTDRGDASVDADTAFEIGSVTKVFTGLLLADMVQRGEVALEDPVERFLPPGTRLGRTGKSPITLLDLATHTAGLPFMPDDVPAFDDPEQASYRTARLYAFLARTEPASNAAWQYSNLGYWLLGEALARRADTSFEGLLEQRVLLPLSLVNTGFETDSRDDDGPLGHNAVLQRAPPFSRLAPYSLMNAAGGLVSTPRDLARFLSIVLGRERSPLAPALTSMLAVARPKGSNERQAIGWVVRDEGVRELVFHDGGTFGFASALAWEPGTRRGVAVLSNQIAGVADLALHALRPDAPLETPTATKRTAIPLSAKILDSYVGSYDGGEEGVFTVLHERDALTLRLPADWGLPPMRVWPETSRDFFAAELPLRVSFEVDAAGRVVGMRVYPPRGQGSIDTVRR